jgi:hypothetical protein
MNRVQRVLVFSIIVAAAAILIAAVRIATLGDDAGTAPEQLESSGDSGAADSADAAEPTAAQPDPARPVRRVKVALVQGIPKGGPAKVRMRVGEELRLTITSTGAEDTVIVNGYELREPVSPTQPARFKIVADQPGFFDVLMQTSGTKLADLDIVR